MTEMSRIDVHSHFIPDAYRQGVAATGRSDKDSFPMVPWSLDEHLATMAAHAIDASILSISDPGLRLHSSGAQGNELARSVNETSGAIIQAHPARFGAFALLPLPDVAAALDETDDALDRLGLDGVGLFTNYDGVYLGDPRFEPLLANLNERHAVVFVHPTDPPGFNRLSLGLWSPVLEFPFDGSRIYVSSFRTAAERCPFSLPGLRRSSRRNWLWPTWPSGSTPYGVSSHRFSTTWRP